VALSADTSGLQPETDFRFCFPSGPTNSWLGYLAVVVPKSAATWPDDLGRLRAGLPDPAPPNFALIAWEEGLPLMS